MEDRMEDFKGANVKLEIVSDILSSDVDGANMGLTSSVRKRIINYVPSTTSDAALGGDKPNRRPCGMEDWKGDF
ncbi:hypothetical protein N7507_000731 [Penicillium longicatenatum]|nr:hypothetical protein N7507_000731 [Penicillium longicatenatum]